MNSWIPRRQSDILATILEAAFDLILIAAILNNCKLRRRKVSQIANKGTDRVITLRLGHKEPEGAGVLQPVLVEVTDIKTLEGVFVVERPREVLVKEEGTDNAIVLRLLPLPVAGEVEEP